MVYKFFDKKHSGGVIKSLSNQQLANDLHKPIIKKNKKKRVYSSFKDNIWDADLAYMQLIITFDKGICYLLSGSVLFSKYARAIPLKLKKGIKIVNSFQKILNKSNRKPKKIWVGKSSKFLQQFFSKMVKR